MAGVGHSSRMAQTGSQSLQRGSGNEKDSTGLIRASSLGAIGASGELLQLRQDFDFDVLRSYPAERFNKRRIRDDYELYGERFHHHDDDELRVRRD